MIEEAVRTLNPAVRDGRLTPELERRLGEPSGHPRRGAAVATLSVQTVGAFPSVEHQLLVVEAVARPPEALERLWCLLLRQRLLETGPSGRPVALAQRAPAGL
jgi:hypothetical protein